MMTQYHVQRARQQIKREEVLIYVLRKAEKASNTKQRDGRSITCSTTPETKQTGKKMLQKDNSNGNSNNNGLCFKTTTEPNSCLVLLHTAVLWEDPPNRTHAKGSAVNRSDLFSPLASDTVTDTEKGHVTPALPAAVSCSHRQIAGKTLGRRAESSTRFAPVYRRLSMAAIPLILRWFGRRQSRRSPSDSSSSLPWFFFFYLA